MKKLLLYIQLISLMFFFGIGLISGKDVLLDVDDSEVHIYKVQKDSHHISFLKEDNRKQQNPANDSNKEDSEEEERKEKEENENQTEKNEKKKRFQSLFLSSDFSFYFIEKSYLVYEHFVQQIAYISYFAPKYILFRNFRI